MPTQTKNWIYTQILEYTDIPQDWKKSKFAKEKAKKLLTGLNNAATNDAEEGLSMAEITKALKKPVWEAAYENAQLTKDRYMAYSYWTHTIIARELVNAMETADYKGPAKKSNQGKRPRRKEARHN